MSHEGPCSPVSLGDCGRGQEDPLLVSSALGVGGDFLLHDLSRSLTWQHWANLLP